MNNFYQSIKLPNKIFSLLIVFCISITTVFAQGSQTTAPCGVSTSISLTANGFSGSNPTTAVGSCGQCCYAGSDLDGDGDQDVSFSVENSKWYKYCNPSASVAITIDFVIDETNNDCNLQGAVFVGGTNPNGGTDALDIDCSNQEFAEFGSTVNGNADGFSFTGITIPAGGCAYVMVDGYGGATCGAFTVNTVCPPACTNPTTMTAGSDIAICEGTPGALNSTVSGGATSGAGLVYSWAPSTGLSSATVADPTANPTATTTYTLTACNGGTGFCCVTDRVVAVVTPNFVANAGADITSCVPSTLTIGGSVASPTGPAGSTYTWVVSGAANANIGITAGATTANPTVVINTGATGSETYQVTVVNGSCTRTDLVTVTSGPLLVNAGADATVCAGSSFVLGGAPTAPAGAVYTWTCAGAGCTGLSMSSTTVANPVVTLTNAATGSATLSVTATLSGCSNTDAVAITINSLPTTPTAIASVSPVCAGLPSTLTASGGSGSGTFSWWTTATAGTNLGVANTLVVSPTITSTYYVQSTDGTSGCISLRGFVPVVVNPTPVANAGSDATLCVGQNRILAGSITNPGACGVQTWTVVSGSGTFSPNANSLTATFTPTSAGTITLRLTPCSPGGCVPVTDDVSFIVAPSPVVTATSTSSTICRGLINDLSGTVSGGTVFPPTLVNQSFSSGVGPFTIPDNTASGVIIPISVSGIANGTLGTTTLSSVTVNVDHNRIQQISVWLCPPGTTPLTGCRQLFNKSGGNGDDLVNTVFTDASATDIAAGTPPYTGAFNAAGTTALASFSGSPTNGTWNLVVIDDVNNPSQTGTAGQWSLNFQTPIPNPPYTYLWTPGANLSSTNEENTSLFTSGIATTMSVITHTLTVTDYNGCNASSNVVTTLITTPTANAGSNQSVCGTSSTLAGNALLAGETGIWTIVSGNGTFSDDASNTSDVSDLNAGANVFEWEVTNSCGTTSSLVTFTSNAVPTLSGTALACVGLTSQLTGSGTAHGSTPWVSSNTAIATITSTGLVRALTVGTTTITYMNSSGCSTFTTFTVNSNPTVSGTLSACSGATSQLTGSATANASTPWVSSNTAIATISSTGLVGGVSDGTATITYMNTNGCILVSTFTVNPVATAAISGSATICVNTSTPINFTGTPNAIVTYTLNGGANTTITLSAGGVASFSTGNLSSPATYTLVGASIGGSCSQAQTGSAIIAINTGGTTVTGFTYTTPACSNAGSATPTLAASFTTGGVFTIDGGGVINASTGAINLATSSAGTHVVTYTYTPSGCGTPGSGTASITITTAPVATISYSGSPFCTNNASAQSRTFSGTAGGTYTSTTGLSISSTTGDITPSTSTGSTYIVSYTIAAANGCPAFTATTPVTITTLPVSTISYSGAPFCTTVGSAQGVTQTGNTGGVYSSLPSGLSLDGTSGSVTPSISTAAAYVVSYTIAANAGCPAVVSTRALTITALPTASISYASSPYCTSISTGQSVTFAGTTGGVFSASPAGLSINSSTGAITPNLSTNGNYTVSYTVTASGGCAAVVATNTVAITALPVATISYANNPACSNETSLLLITQTGTGGGVYSSSPAGLSIVDASIYSIDASTSTAASYIVSYTIAAANGCAAVRATTPLTITALPVATINYSAVPYCKSIAGTQPVTFSGTTGGTYTVSPSGLTLNASTGAITPSSSTAGVYNVTYTIAPSGGCAIVTVTSPLTISAVPVVSAGSTQTLTCALPTANLVATSNIVGSSFSWTGPSITSATNIATITVDDIGTYTTTATTADGCVASNFVVIANNIAQPVVTPGSPKTLTCSSPTVTIDGLSNPTSVNYLWTGGSIVGANDVSTITVNGSGVYTLTATRTDNGCSNFATVTVSPDAGLPNVSVGSDKVITCLVSTFTLGGFSSTVPITYSWSGPSITSATNIASITVDAAGTYILTVTNSLGCSNFAQVEVTLNTTQPDVFAGEDKFFTCLISTLTLDGSSSTSGVDFNWSGPSFVSASNIATPVVDDIGVYTLTVTDQANGCSFSDEVTITEDRVNPTADGGGNQDITCSDPVLTLNGSSNTTGVDFSWAGPSITSATDVASITVDAVGEYYLTVTNPANGCSATSITTVSTNNTPPADVAVTPPVTFTSCTNPTAELIGSSTTASATYSWSGPSIVGATDVATITVDVDGVYTLTVTNPVNGCFVTDFVTVSPNPGAPTIDIPVTTYSLTCGAATVQISGTSTTTGGILSWTGPGIVSQTSVGLTQLAEVNVAGVYTLTVSANGCEITGTAEVFPNVNAPVASINPANPEIACGSTEVELTALPAGLVYSWTGTGIVGDASLDIIQVSEPGVITLIVTDSGNGCSSAPVNVTVTRCNISILADAGKDLTICSNKAPIALLGTTNISTATILWSTTNGTGSFSSTSTSAINYTPSAADISTGDLSFIYKVTDGTGSKSDTIVAKILLAPVASFTTASDSIYVNQLANFIDKTNNALAWYWTFSSAINDTSTVQNPQKTFTSLGVFPITLVATAINGCKDTLVKEIETRQSPIAVPEGFTPNGDGANDVLYVKGGPFKELEFRIFNQWGNEIFFSTKQEIGWAGTYKDLMQPPGVFIFVVKATTLTDEKIDFSGEVNLIH
ncbi:MAG: gliding motility-associated C-terminal domain-containing protein [Bacteroidota bacterium]